MNLDVVQYRVNSALIWAMRIGVVMLVVASIVTTVGPAFADGGGGDAGGGAINTDEITGVFALLGKMAIDIILNLMVIVFAVGMVRSGLAVQTAQQFGLAGKVSSEVANMVGGVLTFVLGMLTMQIVRWVLTAISDVVKPDSDLSELRVPGR